MFQKSEVQHNTDLQVVEYLEKALEVVADLDPPEDLRVVVFEKAADWFAAKSVTLEQVGVAGILGPNAGH